MTFKVFIKRKTRAGKAYACQMLVSFKKLVACIFFKNFTSDICVHCETALVGYNSIFLLDIVRVWC